MNKSRIIRLSLVGGIAITGMIAGGALAGLGHADTAIITPLASPTVVAQPMQTIAPTPTPTAAPETGATPPTVQTQLNNHESRITALEQAPLAPVPMQATTTQGTVSTPVPTPVPLPPCEPHAQVCLSN